MERSTPKDGVAGPCVTRMTSVFSPEKGKVHRDFRSPWYQSIDKYVPTEMHMVMSIDVCRLVIMQRHIFFILDIGATHVMKVPFKQGIINQTTLCACP